MTATPVRGAGDRDLVQRAKVFATETHQRINQRRKYTGQPYDAHLKAVAQIVASAKARAEVVAAAWLHDTVEDTPATIEDIELAFGADVARLVAEVTDVSRPGDGNRAARRAIDRLHLAQASAEGQTIKLADVIDNCRDICRNDPRFAKVYLAEMALLLPVLRAGDPALHRRASALLKKSRVTMHEEGDPPSESAPATEASGFGPRSVPQGFARHRAERLFARLFTVRDIAEPLRSFDGGRAAIEVGAVLAAQGLEVAGVRTQGDVVGYVRRRDLVEGACLDHARWFAPDQVMPSDASLSDVIQVLTRHDRAFVSSFDAVNGVVSRSDIQKPIVRMWLFGMITLLEMDLVRRIRARWPDGAWTGRVPEARLRKATALLEERQRRGQAGDLLDCLQLPDKAQVLLDVPEELSFFGLASNAAARKVIKDLESLRNNLAHAQDIVTHDWPQVARMTRRLEDDSPGG